MTEQNVDYHNKYELHCIALKRSGHHAIANWIIRQASPYTCFLNDIDHHRINPFEDINSTKENGKNKKRNWYYLAYPKKKQYDLKKEIQGTHDYKDYLVFTYEDRPLIEIANSQDRETHTKEVGKSLNLVNLMVIRDPYNLFASRAFVDVFYKNRHKSCDSYSVNLWKSFAKEYLDKTNILKNKMRIKYNSWFKDREYRKTLANQLELEFNDSGLEEVQFKAYRGSSFDKGEYNGKAQQMKVLERWKRGLEREQYINVFRDKELIALSDEIFEEAEIKKARDEVLGHIAKKG